MGGEHDRALVLLDRALEEGWFVSKAWWPMPWAALTRRGRAPSTPGRTGLEGGPVEYGAPGRIAVARRDWPTAVNRLLKMRSQRYRKILSVTWWPAPGGARRDRFVGVLEADLVRLLGSARITSSTHSTAIFRVLEDLDAVPPADQNWSAETREFLDHDLAFYGGRYRMTNWYRGERLRVAARRNGP